MFPRIQFDSIPMWYDLGVTDGGKGISVRVDCGAWARLDYYLQVWKRSEESLPLFELPGPLGWGYDKAMGMPGVKGRFVEMEIRLPALCVFSSKREGTQCDENNSVARSISLLLEFLHLVGSDFTTDSSQVQLLAANIIPYSGGGAVVASISKRLHDWLSRQSVVLCDQITKHMRMAWLCMEGVASGEFVNESRASLTPDGRICFQVFGDACDLSPAEYISEGMGYDLQPHNMSVSSQQLTILVGLASLNHYAREAGL